MTNQVRDACDIFKINDRVFHRRIINLSVRLNRHVLLTKAKFPSFACIEANLTRQNLNLRIRLF